MLYIVRCWWKGCSYVFICCCTLHVTIFPFLFYFFSFVLFFIIFSSYKYAAYISHFSSLVIFILCMDELQIYIIFIPSIWICPYFPNMFLWIIFQMVSLVSISLGHQHIISLVFLCIFDFVISIFKLNFFHFWIFHSTAI
jgi:hypothetical protein